MSNVSNGMARLGVLEMRSEREGDEHVIALAGELDVAGVERVDEELERVEATDARRIVLDLRDLEFIDSSGIRLIIQADARSRANGNRLCLVRGPRHVQRVFEITDLAGRLPFSG